MYKVRLSNAEGAYGILSGVFSDEVAAIAKGDEWEETQNSLADADWDGLITDFIPCEEYTYEVIWESPQDGTIVVFASKGCRRSPRRGAHR